jgi:D-3-phosphoglycerate dehydrogenase
MGKVLITTVPFGRGNRLPLDLLEEAGVRYDINPLGKKLTEGELAELVADHEVIIAGTEPITDAVMERGKNLRLISRVGIGLDSVDLLSAEKRGIKVSYTPDAPAPAVAELTIGLMLCLLRSVHVANAELHQGTWTRFMGRRIAEVTVGVIGVGRIGARVIRRIAKLGTPRVLVNDLIRNKEIDRELKVEWMGKEDIYRQADVISIHVPLTKKTKHMVRRAHMETMKSDALLINTSRGGVIHEGDLYDALRSQRLGGAAIDVFEEEPYTGRLAELDTCLMTSHMGSMSLDCRLRMELEATEETIRFLQGKPLEREVPESEYEVQRQGL